MRVMRCGLYVERGVPPMHTILTERDVSGPLEDATSQMIAFPHGFVYHEVFEMPEGDIVAASLEGQKRYEAQKLREHNIALVWIWYTAALEKTNENGTIAATKPAPLSAADLRMALEQVPKHPLYRNQTVMTIAEDNTIVKLEKGKVYEVKP